MKDRNSINSEIVKQIRTNIIGCECQIRNQKKTISEFISFDGELEFNNDFELSDVPLSGPTNFVVIFKTIVMLKMNENQHNSHRISGEYGPINLSYDNRSYNLDFIDSHFSSMVVY